MMADFHLAHVWFWLAVLAASGLVYLTVQVIYRVYFHPLAAYPGPLLAKLTNGYMLYHAWKGDRHLELWRLHERHGDAVRFGPNSVSFRSATALRDIYGFRSNVGKAEFYDAFVHPAPNTHNIRDREAHARKRRVLSQAFSDGAMREMEKYLLANVRTFCREVGKPSGAGNEEGEKGWTGPRNMANWCSWLATDILGDLCFGKEFHMLERPDNRYAIDLIIAATKRHLICGTMPIINTLSLDKVLFRRIAAGRARYMAYSRAQLAERTALGDDADRRDFFHHLLKARDPHTGQGFSTSELWGESNLLIIAGSDTTSTAMAATLFYLVRNGDALARATAEVRGAFGEVEDIRQGSALTGCTYLRACIDEAMRLSPSVPGLLPREVLVGGTTIDGHAVPAGTVVGTPHYAIHHHPAYYPEPFSFVPERWIAGAQFPGAKGVDAERRTVSDADVAAAQSAFCPFSVGPRGCIGKGLAYAEMTTTLARLLFVYDVRKAVGVADPGEGREGAAWGRHRVGEYQLADIFTSSKNGPLLQLRKRV